MEKVTDDIYVTHYIHFEQNKNGWIELPFITRKGREDNYYLGFQFNTPIPTEVFHENTMNGYYIPITTIPEKIDISQSLWISENGELWIADSEDPFYGKRKRIVGSSEYEPYLSDAIKFGENNLKRYYEQLIEYDVYKEAV